MADGAAASDASASASEASEYFDDAELLLESDSDDDGGAAVLRVVGPSKWSEVDVEDMDAAAARLASLSLTAAAAGSAESDDALLAKGAAIHAAAAAASSLDDVSVANADLLQLGELDSQTLGLVRPGGGAPADADGNANDEETVTASTRARKLSAAARPRVASVSAPPDSNSNSANADPANAAEVLTRLVSPASPAFDPVAYVWHVHRETTFADIKAGQANLESSLARQTDLLRRLVKANFDRFIRCRDTIADISVKLADTERDFFGPDSNDGVVGSLRGWKAAVDDEFATLLKLQERLDHLKRLQGSMARRRALFLFPDEVRSLALAGRYEEATSEVNRARRMLCSQQASSSAPLRTSSGMTQLSSWSNEGGSSAATSPRNHNATTASSGEEDEEDCSAVGLLLDDVEQAASALAGGLRKALLLRGDETGSSALTPLEAVRAALLLYQLEVARDRGGVDVPAMAPVAEDDPLEVHINARADGCISALQAALRLDEQRGAPRTIAGATECLHASSSAAAVAVELACTLLETHLEGLWAVHATFAARDAVQEMWASEHASASDGKGARVWKTLRNSLKRSDTADSKGAEPTPRRYFEHMSRPKPREYYVQRISAAAVACADALVRGVAAQLATVREQGEALLTPPAVDATLLDGSAHGVTTATAMTHTVARCTLVLGALHRSAALLTGAAARLPASSDAGPDLGFADVRIRLAALAKACAVLLGDFASSFAVLRAECLRQLASSPASDLATAPATLWDCARWNRLLVRRSGGSEEHEDAVPYGGTLAITLHFFDAAIDLSAAARPAAGILAHWHAVSDVDAGPVVTETLRGALAPLPHILPPDTFAHLELHGRSASTRVLPRVADAVPASKDAVGAQMGRWQTAHLHVLAVLRDTLQALGDAASAVPDTDVVDMEAVRDRMLRVVNAAATAARSVGPVTALCLGSDVPSSLMAEWADVAAPREAAAESWQSSVGASAPACRQLLGVAGGVWPLVAVAPFAPPRDDPARASRLVGKQLSSLSASLSGAFARVFGAL